MSRGAVGLARVVGVTGPRQPRGLAHHEHPRRGARPPRALRRRGRRRRPGHHPGRRHGDPTVTGNDVVRFAEQRRRAAGGRRGRRGRPAPGRRARLVPASVSRATVRPATSPVRRRCATRVARAEAARRQCRVTADAPVRSSTIAGRARGPPYLLDAHDATPAACGGSRCTRGRASAAPCWSTTAPAASCWTSTSSSEADRVVCDDDNDITVLDVPCTHGLRPHRARTGERGEGRERRLRPGRRRLDVLPPDRRRRPDPAARRSTRAATRACRRRCASASPAAAADCPRQTRSGTAWACTTARGSPAPTTWSATR